MLISRCVAGSLMVFHIDDFTESLRQSCEVRAISLPIVLMRKLNSEDLKLDSNPGGLGPPRGGPAAGRTWPPRALGLRLSARPLVSTPQVAARGISMIADRRLRGGHGNSWGHQTAHPSSGPCLALRTRSDDTALCC